MKQHLVAAFLLAGMSTAAVAKPEVGVGVNVGTLGLGVAATFAINERLNARVGVTKGSLNFEEELDGVDYEGDLDIQSFSALLDWHPWQGTFRVTAGLVRNGSDVTADAQINKEIEIGGTTYQVNDIGSVSGKVDMGQTAPYIGVGWGNAVNNKSGSFRFAADIGVILGDSPDISLKVEDPNNLVNQADIDAEMKKLQDDIDDISALATYPFINIGMSYHF